MQENQVFPPLKPERNGLLGPATIVVELDQEIKNIFVEDLLAQLHAGIESWCLDTDVTKEVLSPFEEELENKLFRPLAPFNIRTSFRASTFDTDPEELEARANLALSLVEEKVIERELWLGEFSSDTNVADTWAANPYLLDDSVEVISGTYSPQAGMAVLEGAYADRSHGLLPTLYMPRSAASRLNLRSKPDDLGAYRNKIGTRVIPGSGFKAEAGQSGLTLTDHQVPAVISGPAVVLLGPAVVTPDEAFQAINRSKNDIRYFAERQAVALALGGAKFTTVIDVTL